MNWYKRAVQYVSEITDEVPPEKQERFRQRWNRSIPSGYQVMLDDNGNWAVLRPPRYEGEPEEQRKLVETEETRSFSNPNQAKDKVLDQALTRIGFESSPDNEDEADNDKEWAQKFREWQQQQQQSQNPPESVQAWAMKQIVKHASGSLTDK